MISIRKTVIVRAEPEPDCLLETTNDVIHWFEDERCRNPLAQQQPPAHATS